MEDYDSLGARQQPYEETRRVLAYDFEGKPLFEGEEVYELEGYLFRCEDLTGVLERLDKEILLELLDSFKDSEIIYRSGIEKNYVE